MLSLFQRVMDAETFIFNITEANAIGSSQQPSYFRLYSMREDLDMPSLFPRDFDNLAWDLSRDDTLWEKFEL